MDRSCFDCQFWDQSYTDGEVGLCRRNAPLPVQFAETENADGDRGERDAVWPTTANDDWCGQFVAGPDESLEQFELERKRIVASGEPDEIF